MQHAGHCDTALYSYLELALELELIGCMRAGCVSLSSCRFALRFPFPFLSPYPLLAPLPFATIFIPPSAQTHSAHHPGLPSSQIEHEYWLPMPLANP